MSTIEQLVDDSVRRHAPPPPQRGFLGFQASDGYRLLDPDNPKLVWGRTEDGNSVKAYITGGLTVAQDTAVLFRKRYGRTYAYPDTFRDADTGTAAARTQEAQFGIVDSLRLQPGLVGFVDGQLTLTPEPLIYTNWRGELCRSLGSPLPIGAAISALGASETAWVLAGVDERTNDSAYHVSTATENEPDIQQAIDAAKNRFLFQFQMAVLIQDGQAVLAFTYEKWKDLRPWGATATRQRDNYAAVTDPTATDDISVGYDVFSRWLNGNTGVVWQCLDGSEGAADWQPLGSPGDGPPDAANVTYTPANTGDWSEGTPDDVAQALDTLAGRDGGGGTGDFLADGSVPMTGDFDAGANNVTNVDVLEVNEVAAPATPAAGKVAVYAKSDGKLYAKDDAGTEYDLTAQGSATLPAFGTGVTKTLSSGVAAAGSDRHLVIAAESGTADDLIEVSGLSVGDECIIRADTGDTITVKHNDAGATDKIILYNSADIALSGDKTLKIVKTEAGKVVQYVDEKGTGVGGAVSGQEVRIRVYREVLASAGVFDVEDTELLTGWSFTDFEHLQIRLRAFASVTTVGAYPIKMYYNNDKTDGNYSSGRDFGTASSTPNINYIGGSAAGASGTDLTIDLDFINETGVRRTAKAHGFDSRGSNNDSNSLFVHVWENTAAINRVAFEVGNATNTFQSGAILEIIGIYYES